MVTFHDADTDTDTDILADFRASIVHEPMSVRDARVYTCTVRDKLPCTRLQNYTIGSSLMSASVSVPWNSSFKLQHYTPRVQESDALVF